MIGCIVEMIHGVWNIWGCLKMILRNHKRQSLFSSCLWIKFKFLSEIVDKISKKQSTKSEEQVCLSKKCAVFGA